MRNFYQVTRLFSLCALVCTMLLLPATLSSQTRKNATGTVEDASGAPVIGASVVFGNQGTTTDLKGTFTLMNVPIGSFLRVQYLGLTTQEVVFDGEPLHIVMESDAVSMNDIIVVGYGETTRGAFTGSASVVDSEQLSLLPVNNIFDALKGQVTGLQERSSSSSPGSTPEFRIRGVGSISASASPLIVLDGTPYSGNWNSINPNDVESITVLKDAASTAIYGARGGNGVILVTTKKAKRGEARITFDAKLGVNKMNKNDTYDYITDPGDYYKAHYKAMYNYFLNDQGQTAEDAHRMANSTLGARPDGDTNNYYLGYMVYTYPESEYLIDADGKLNPNATLGRKYTYNGKDYWVKPDSWWDEGYQTGIRQDYTLSVSGGNEKQQTFASLGYTKDEGIIPTSGFERFTARIKTDYQLRDWVKFGGNIMVTKQDRRQASGIQTMVTNMAPIYPVYIRDGDGNIMEDEHGKMYDFGSEDNAGLQRPYSANSNTLKTNSLNTNRTVTMMFNASAYVDLNITNKIKFTVNGTLLNSDGRANRASQPYYNPVTYGGGVLVNHSRTTEFNTQQILRYSDSFKGGHNLNGFIAHEYLKRNGNRLYGQRSNMYSYFGNQELDGAVNIINWYDSSDYPSSNGSSSSGYRNQSFFTQWNYDYMGKYYLSADFRREGSTRFYKDNRWGNFWSVSGSWLINRENWFNADWVDFLKIRASYGQAGNDGISDGLYDDRFSLRNLLGDPSIKVDRKGARDITWETNGTFDVAMDFELFGGRLGGTVEYFNRTTSDMLLSIALALSSGYNDYLGNAGKMRTSGIEWNLRGDIIKTRKVTWSAYANMSLEKNRILELPNERKTTSVHGEMVGWYSSSRLTAVGYSRYEMWMATFAGLDENGKALFYLRDDDDVITDTTDDRANSDMYLAGDAFPKAYGGFGTTVTWKGFDLTLTFNYRIGGKAYDSGYASAMTAPYGSNVGRRIHKDYVKSWTAENPNNDYAVWQYTGQDEYIFTGTSSRWVYDASYLNFKNVTLGYTIPSDLTRKIGVGSIRVSASLDNVWFKSARKGFHPDYDWDGTTSATAYPGARSIVFGVNMRF